MIRDRFEDGEKCALIKCTNSPVSTDPADGFRQTAFMYSGELKDQKEFRCPHCGRQVKPQEPTH